MFLKFSRAGISAMRPTRNRSRGARIRLYGTANPTNPMIPRRLIKTIGLVAMTGRQKGNDGPEKGRAPVSIAGGCGWSGIRLQWLRVEHGEGSTFGGTAFGGPQQVLVSSILPRAI